jgi:transposase
MAADALGNPVRWLLTGGQVNEITQAPILIFGLQFEALIADKGFDSNAFRALIEGLGAEVVIPPIKAAHRKLPEYDRHAYRERHLIECLFSRLKQFRRIATRYEKLARNFLSMLNLASTYVWLA